MGPFPAGKNFTLQSKEGEPFLESVFGNSECYACPQSMLSVIPRSGLVFLDIYTKDKTFEAKSHTGVSEKERSDTSRGPSGKATRQHVFTKLILQWSRFQMFGQTHALPSRGRAVICQDLSGRASRAQEA